MSIDVELYLLVSWWIFLRFVAATPDATYDRRPQNVVL